MHIELGDSINVLDTERQETRTQRVAGIFLNHSNLVHPRELPFIDPSLYRTLNHEYLAVSIDILLDSGEELSYTDLGRRFTIDTPQPTREDGPDMDR